MTEKKPIAAFDLDGTIYRGNLVSRLCEELCRNGYISGLYAQNMVDLFVQRDNCQIPHRQYEQKLVNLLLVALRRKSQSELMRTAETVTDRAADQSFFFTTTLLDSLRRSHDCIAITGGMREAAELLAEHWGFDVCFASVCEVAADLYTGRIIAAPAQNKGEVVRARAAASNESTLDHSIAVGDSVSDILLLEAVERPIAFNPDASLAAMAESRHWPIVLERKNMIYVMQCGTCQLYPTSQAIRAVRSVISECRELQ
ncbi:MAG: HAD-IB family phosphatase [Patescibacteria group bacterium]